MERKMLQQTQALLQSVGQSGEFGSTRVEVLRCCLQLLRTLHESGAVNVSDAGPESHNLLVAKAGLELVVRWGICPHLNPGVGIPQPKRTLGKGAASLAAAVTEHLGGRKAGDKMELEHFFSEAALQDLEGQKELLAETADALFQIAQEEGPVGQLVGSHHLADLFAAFLQLEYDGGEAGRRRLDEMVNRIPVAHAVEALMILLTQNDPAPPGWFNQQAGKLLSRLVLQEGGVGAVLERLVGEAEYGDVTAYRRAAIHLARCPESVTTREQYYSRVCPQLLQLFLLSPGRPPLMSEGTVRAVTNMQQTSVMLACLMFKQDSKLSEEHLLRALVENLLIWAASNRGNDEEGKGKVMAVTESSLLDSLWQLHALVTAGHEGSKLLKPSLFRLIQPAAPLLLSLHTLMEQAPGKKGSQEAGLAKGFLNKKGDVTPALLIGQEELQPLHRLTGVLDDIAVAIVGLPVKRALPAATAYLLESSSRDIKWPDASTSIGNSLELGRGQCRDPAMHLVKLIRGCKNWKLTVSLMEHLLFKLVQFRQAQIASEADLSKLEHVFEVISDEIGSIAMEEDLLGSLSVMTNLLEKNEFVQDEDMTGLVFHMLGSCLPSLKQIFQPGDQVQMAPYQQVLQKLERLLSAITKRLNVTPKVKDMSSSLAATLLDFSKST